MEIILKNLVNESIKRISFKDFDTFGNLIDQLNQISKPAQAILITINESIKAQELLKLKILLQSLNIKINNLYTDSIEILLSGKSLKINSILLNEKDIKNKFFRPPVKKHKDVFHKGTVRSGTRISSNGDLFVIGDVNPGGIVSAKNNVYIWGKLLGIAFAGEDGDKTASITSLYLNPLQLRICDKIALGPKEKPKYQYPEVALLEGNSIIIKPYIISF